MTDEVFPTTKGEIRVQTFLTTLLPNGRRAELKAGTLSVWTRSGEELTFNQSDVRVMTEMFKRESLIAQAPPKSD